MNRREKLQLILYGLFFLSLPIGHRIYHILLKKMNLYIDPIESVGYYYLIDISELLVLSIVASIYFLIKKAWAKKREAKKRNEN
ncbi:hypothetical protein [Marininema halotolerans]|uniref:Uncharacterized protein n=1 Tax=Marininema halotolerans TaxID=1155944 RepID=A0A1I6RHM8_9BACL|nr:hypothetical protein [Marininema halotolerans]SFS64090.1 hypothetical protein SAMN05444972_10592 [Marininema halotolerans]